MRTARPHPDAIADCVLSAFSALPQKYKPRRLADGRREWVPLAGIVLSRPQIGLRGTPHHRKDGGTEFKCVSLATGMKCLPHAKVQTARGCVLHDCHAEVLAIRGFNRWLVDECADLARRGYGKANEEGWVKWKAQSEELERVNGTNQATPNVVHGELHEPPFELQQDVQVHMYCSEAPCGDASMELVMREQEDDTPWERDASVSNGSAVQSGRDGSEGTSMLGRGYFSHLGIVRRKPARPDAPATLSKSCSDKLAMKQCTGLLSSLTTRLVGSRGTWLDTLVLPHRAIVQEAMERAFGPSGRMKGVAQDQEIQSKWQTAGYRYQAFEVLPANREFEYARQAAAGSTKPVPSNLAIVCMPCGSEIVINGVLQGRRQDDPNGASCICRRRMWEAVCGVEHILGLNNTPDGKQTYAQAKYGIVGAKQREAVKADVRSLALKAWTRNTGDEQWMLPK